MLQQPILNDRTIWLQLFICLVIGAAISVALGQDANFDLRNYHIYTPYSILTGRFDVDVLPAGAQTTTNPTLDFLYLWLATGPLAYYPRVLAAVMGLWYGLLVFVVLRLAMFLFGDIPSPERSLLIALGTLTAVTGAVTFSQIGTTFNDIPAGMMILAGLLLILKSLDAPGAQLLPDKKGLLAGGLLFGLSAGCKLTGGIYAPAMCLALLAALPPRAWMRACAFFSAGWLAGFIPPFSWWGWMLWSRFGNPVFPLLNNIFRSPLIAPVSYINKSFFPHDVWQGLAYPFFWAWRVRENLVIEPAFRDPRMAIAYAAFIALAAPALIGTFCRLGARTPPENPAPAGLTRAQRTALAFLVLSYIAWLVTFCIIRYAVVIEAMAVLGTIIMIRPLAQQFSPRFARQTAVAFALLACIVSLSLTHYMRWERVPYGNKVFDVDMSWTPPNALFVTVGRPVAYLAAFVPPEAHARFVDYDLISGQYDWPLGKKAGDMLRTNPGPIIVLVTGDIMLSLMKFTPIKRLAVQLGSCRTIRSNLDFPLNQPILACNASRI